MLSGILPLTSLPRCLMINATIDVAYIYFLCWQFKIFCFTCYQRKSLKLLTLLRTVFKIKHIKTLINLSKDLKLGHKNKNKKAHQQIQKIEQLFSFSRWSSQCGINWCWVGHTHKDRDKGMQSRLHATGKSIHGHGAEAKRELQALWSRSGNYLVAGITGLHWETVRNFLSLRHTITLYQGFVQPFRDPFQESHLPYPPPACPWSWILIRIFFLLQFSGLRWRIECEWCSSSQTHIFLRKEVREGVGTETHYSLPASCCGRWQCQWSCHLDGETFQ